MQKIKTKGEISSTWESLPLNNQGFTSGSSFEEFPIVFLSDLDIVRAERYQYLKKGSEGGPCPAQF